MIKICELINLGKTFRINNYVLLVWGRLGTVKMVPSEFAFLSQNNFADMLVTPVID